MLAKTFVVTQDNVSFHLKVTDNDVFSPLDDLRRDYNLEANSSTSASHNYYGLIGMLKELDEGEYIIDKDYDIFYRLADDRDSSFWYYGNLETIIDNLLATDRVKTLKEAMEIVKRDITSEIEYLQGFMSGYWGYLDMVIEKVVVTKTEAINGNFFAISTTHETDHVWHVLSWDNLDNCENYDQLSELLLDCMFDIDEDFGITHDTLSDICHHIDYDDWKEDR